MAIKKYIDNKTNLNLATTTSIDRTTAITQKESTTDSTNAPTSISVSTTSSTPISTSTSSSTTASTTASTTSSATTHTNCYPIDKLVFGDLSDLGGDLNVFCKEMCGFKCKPLLAEFKSNLFKNEANIRPNQDLMACLETCPLLCKCDDQP